MMRDFFRFATGATGNAFSMLLYLAPILTFKRIVRNRSTEDFSCLPYIAAFFNGLIYTWYGMPVVSLKWENLTLVTCNGCGALVELAYIITYIRFTSTRGKKVTSLAAGMALIFSAAITLISFFSMREHRDRKMMVGSVGLCASATMYTAPLVAVKRVIETKSVEFMPFRLSFFCFAASGIWMIYGILAYDLLLVLPNVVGCVAALLQLVLYFMYRKRDVIPHSDLEKAGDDEDGPHVIWEDSTLELTTSSLDKLPSTRT